jgi:plasmid stability protein
MTVIVEMNPPPDRTTPRSSFGRVADVKIRKLAKWVVASFRAWAKRAGRSLEEELRQFLTEAVRGRRRRFADKLEAFTEQLRSNYGEMLDSTLLMREGPDEFG